VAGRTDDIGRDCYAGQVVEKAPTTALFDTHRQPLQHRGAAAVDAAALSHQPHQKLEDHPRPRPPQGLNALPAGSAGSRPACGFARGLSAPRAVLELVEETPGHQYTRCNSGRPSTRPPVQGQGLRSSASGRQQ